MEESVNILYRKDVTDADKKQCGEQIHCINVDHKKAQILQIVESCFERNFNSNSQELTKSAVVLFMIRKGSAEIPSSLTTKELMDPVMLYWHRSDKKVKSNTNIKSESNNCILIYISCWEERENAFENKVLAEIQYISDLSLLTIQLWAKKNPVMFYSLIFQKCQNLNFTISQPKHYTFK